MLIAGLGYVSMAGSLAEVVKRKDATRAHALAHWNGRVAGLLAAQRFIAAPTSSPDGEIASLARMALRRDPTVIDAVTTLGFQAQMRNDSATAHRMFDYSQRLSRRDLQTHVWLIEDAVRRGEIPEALRHYDMALRTSKAAPDLLFPVLSNAITEPDIQSSLVNILAEKPLWSDYFIAYLANKHGDPRANAHFFLQLRKIGLSLPDEVVAGAINGLLAQRDINAAWAFYARFRPGADPRRSRDPSFASDLSAPSVFDWTPLNDAVVTTSIERDGRRGFFSFSTTVGAGGTVLQQAQLLSAGVYRIVGHATGIVQSSQPAAYWALTCEDGRELGRVDVKDAGGQRGTFAGQFSVPAGCPRQTLSLVARAINDNAGSSGQIDWVQLSPAT